MLRSAMAALLFLQAGILSAQDTTFRGQVDVAHQSRRESGSGDVVVWLASSRLEPAGTSVPGPAARLVQKNKRFAPHVVAVQVGSEIEFPNLDPFFHDVFSIYRGKPFDLGLYEGGAVRKVRFSQPGVSYIFCNIHPGMSAAVLALPTTHFAVTGRDGSFQIAHVPLGHYKLQFWYELASESELASLAREIDITSDSQPVKVALHSSDTPPNHLDKYGHEYLAEKRKNY
jgi:plastocyanin